METVLIFGAREESFARMQGARAMGDGELHLPPLDPQQNPLCLLFERDLNRATRRLGARPVDAVVLDAREGMASSVLLLLDRLFPAHEAATAVRRGRAIVAVAVDEGGLRVAHAAGERRLAEVLISPDPERMVSAIRSLFSQENRGRIALCLAGGGVEGLLYEIGVLRALDEFLTERRVVDIDLFFGISAGAILASFLANGLSPAEIAEGLRRGTNKLDRISRRDIFDPNVGELLSRLGGFVKDLMGRGDARNVVSAAYRAIPTGVFAGDRLTRYLARQLRRPGMSDSFHSTRKPLFVGATDQDTNEAVVFGEPGYADVPVHQAVRASCALIPFYKPQKIEQRYYIDGAFTRTTNMRVAAKHGATLVLLVDPLVPVRAESPGYVHKRGGLFGAMQGLKCLINGRFDKAEGAIREMYPNVAFHLFRPEGDEMRILSGSPMKFLYREEVEQLAYERTRRKLLDREAELSRDFRRNGWSFRAPSARTRPEVDLGLLAHAAV
jgi:predicted acylesterase/phospholipase RssA